MSSDQVSPPRWSRGLLTARALLRRADEMSPAGKATLLMVAATILVSFMHAAIRHLSAWHHPFEIAFFRSFFGLLVFLPFVAGQGFAILRTERLPLHLARGAVQTVAMLMFFTSLSLLPLAQVSGLSFTSPLFVSVIAVLWLGERLRLRRTAALLIGFAGTLLIIRPGAVTIEVGSLLVLASSALWAFAVIMVKTLSRTDSSATIVIYMNLLLTPLALVPALFVWQWPTGGEYLWFLGLGVLATSAHLAMTQAFKYADASALMPYDFTRLLWTSLLGFVIFAEVPSLWTIAGGAVIFGSAAYIAYREARIGANAGAARALGRGVP